MITRNEKTEGQLNEMIEEGAEKYAAFMDVVFPGWKEDPNSKDTPRRVAKMFIKELSEGLYLPMPKITSFENVDKYDGIVFQGNIEVKSFCSHHHMPFMGKAYVAYIPDEKGKIIGLSKLNRVVRLFSKRPQVQENLTQQIHDYLNDILGKNKGIAVFIEAQHTCVSHRGIEQDSTMKTAKLSGYFFSDEIGTRQEFYRMVADMKR